MPAVKKSIDPSKNKKDKVITALIISSIVLIIFSFLAPVILTTPLTNNKYNFKETGPIGDTIGGLMNPFIALAGVFITFLAFYMQLKANQIQIALFNRNQQEQTNLLKEQLFFRLFDNLNQRIINFSYVQKSPYESNEYASYKALDNLIINILNRIDDRCINLGRHLLSKIPEQIGINHYVKILQTYTSGHPSPFEAAEEIRNEIIDQKNYNERWEYIKRYVGSTDNESHQKKMALQSIGHVMFYKIEFSEREDIYSVTYQETYQEHGGFMDGYTKNLSYLVEFVINNIDNPFYVDYLKNNLSTQELVLIFYYCSSTKSNERIRKQINEVNLLEGLFNARDRFIDLPSQQELKSEIHFILNKIDFETG